jgi:hypothetical protein
MTFFFFVLLPHITVFSLFCAWLAAREVWWKEQDEVLERWGLKRRRRTPKVAPLKDGECTVVYTNPPKDRDKC